MDWKFWKKDDASLGLPDLARGTSTGLDFSSSFEPPGSTAEASAFGSQAPSLPHLDMNPMSPSTPSFSQSMPLNSFSQSSNQGFAQADDHASNHSQKDFEVIAAKLDTLRAQMETINARLATIEQRLPQQTAADAQNPRRPWY